MKNIHIIPTEKPSRLCKDELGTFHITESMVSKISFFKNQNIYITFDEKRKQGDWVIYTKGIKIHCKKLDNKEDVELANIENSGVLKIILTTDQDLINDGVQSIDDEFLEWFVAHPSCEKVDFRLLAKLNKSTKKYEDFWEILIPEEEPKQECDANVLACLNEKCICKAEKIKTGYTASETELLGVQITLKDGSQQFIPKQETLEEVTRVAFNLGYDKGTKYQYEQDRNKYSEEIEMLWLKYRAYTNNEDAWSFKEWLVEQFKKK
jgi:hypothetical protein